MSTRRPEGLALTLEQARTREDLRHAFLSRPAAFSAARPGPLSGVPFSLKDVWDVAGLPTTAGTPRFAQRVPAASGAVCQAFEAAGAVLVGKTNLSELALTPECASLVGGRTSHPLDASRTPLGSSGGAAVAVAMGLSGFDWGSDFGGSIRLPAAACGVVGLRLSASEWPPLGHVPPGDPASQLNGMGPLTASVEDARRVLRAVEGQLRLGSTPEVAPVQLECFAPDARTQGQWPGFAAAMVEVAARLGLPLRAASLPAPLEVEALFTRTLARCWPSWELGLGRGRGVRALSSLLRPWHPSLHPDTAAVVVQLSLLARREAFRRDGGLALQRLREGVRAAWARGTIFLSPTLTWPAPRHGQARTVPGLTAFVKLGNLVDATALSIPWGRFADGFPRGLQLLGPPGSEQQLLNLAQGLQPGL